MSEHRYAFKVLIKYDGQPRLDVVGKIRYEMWTPPGEAGKPPAIANGFWIELRDRRDRVRYWRVHPSPVHYTIETPTGRGGEHLSRTPVTVSEAHFSLLVPDIPDARKLVIFSSPFDAARDREDATVVASVDLDTLLDHSFPPDLGTRRSR